MDCNKFESLLYLPLIFSGRHFLRKMRRSRRNFCFLTSNQGRLLMLKKIMTGLLFGLFVFCAVGLHAADDRKPILTVSESGYDNTWNTVDRLADAMGYGLFMKSFEEIRKNIAKEGGIKKDQPIGIVVLSDNKEFFPFFFAPIAKFADFETLHNYLGENLENKKGKFYYRCNDKVSIELLQKEGWLYGFAQGQADKLPQGDPARFLNVQDKNDLLSVRLYIENISNDLLDLAFAPIRQVFADKNVPSAQAEQLKIALDYIKKACRDFRSINYGIKVDSKNNLIFTTGAEVKPETEIAKTLGGLFTAKTRWNHLYDPNKSVVGVTSLKTNTSDSIEFLKQYYKTQFDNYRAEIKKNVEKESDRKTVNAILDNLQKVVISTMTLPSYAYAMMLTPDPMIVVGSDLAEGALLCKTLEQIANYYKADNPDFFKEYVKLNAEKINGYNVSVLTLPLSTFNLTEDWIKDKELFLKIGIKDNSLLCLLNVDKKAAEGYFKKLAESKVTEEPLPKQLGSLSLLNLGKLLDFGGPDSDKLDKQFIQTRKILKQASPQAKITVSQEFQKNIYSCQLVWDAQCFKLIGDTIRGLSAGGIKTTPKAPKLDPKELEKADKLFD